MTVQSNEQMLSSMKSSLAKRVRVLLPGATLSGPFQDSFNNDLLVCYNTKHQLRVYTPPELSLFFVFERRIPFTEVERSFLERIILATFDKSNADAGALDENMARAIVRTISEYAAPACQDTALRVISLYESWQGQQRNRLSHTTGITVARNKNVTDNFFAIAQQNIVKSLGSSPDTLLIIDANGGIRGLEKIPPTKDSAGRQEIFSPDTHANLAMWANSRRKVAVRLTEDGAIMIFSRGRLLFFKQDSCWTALPHTLSNAAFCSEGTDGIEPETLKALYLTALDMAKGKTPLQVAIILNSHKENATAKLRKVGWQHIARAVSKNIKLLSVLENTTKFHEIPRTIRSEIGSMGGTLFLDGEGNILGIDPIGDKFPKPEAACSISNRYFPGRGYMEMLNDHKYNLQLTIC